MAIPSDLNQRLFLGALPDGLQFKVLDVRPSIPDQSGWRATFTHPDEGSTSIGPQGHYDYITYPFEITPSNRGGLIGETKLSGSRGVVTTGRNPKVHIRFRLLGTLLIHGKWCKVDDEGFFSVSSSDWKGLECPEASNVTYYWPGGKSSVTASLKVSPSVAGMPENLHVIVGISVEENRVAINATTDDNVVQEAASKAIEGKFLISDKLFGWARGVLIPFV